MLRQVREAVRIQQRGGGCSQQEGRVQPMQTYKDGCRYHVGKEVLGPGLDSERRFREG